MKHSQSINICVSLFLAIFSFFSCSNDDSSAEGGGGSTTSPASIELQTNISTNTAKIDETVNFAVKGNDGKDYTSKSKLYLEGVALTGMSYEFTEGGTYEFTAKFNNLTSNKIAITVEEGTAASQPDNITLTSDLQSSKADINKSVTFRIMGDNGVEYTSLSTIKVNGEIINGNRFTFNQGGEHEITASYNDIHSNTLSIQVLSSNYITVSRNKVLRGQEIHLEYFGPDGENDTGNATFFVNGTAINGNTFSSSTEGSFEVAAKNKSGEETEAKTVEVFIPGRKAFFEDYTGTWCGWCPRVTNAIILLKERTEDLVVVAVHYQDEMMIDEALELVNHFEIELFPHARLNRTSVVEFPQDKEEQLEKVLAFAGAETNFSIGINTSLINNLLEIEVKLISEVQIPANHKLLVYILQNTVIFPQENYLNNDPESRWYQKGYPIENFVHDDVLEISLTPILGDPLDAIPAFEEIVYEFGPVDLSQYAYSATGNSYNPNNFEVVAILTTEDNTALNAQKVTAGHNVDFE